MSAMPGLPIVVAVMSETLPRTALPMPQRRSRPLFCLSLLLLLGLVLQQSLPSGRAAVALRGTVGGDDVAFVGFNTQTIVLLVCVSSGAAALAAAQRCGFKMDVPLLAYFAMWYLGNYYYNITNKRCLNAAGGADGFPLTISTLQLGVGSLYCAFLWCAPDARATPKLDLPADLTRALPVSLAFAGAHCASVFSMNVGGVSFGQIVKAAEPAFAAFIGVAAYSSGGESRAKTFCLVPVIGGVILASLGELDFSILALLTAAGANACAAFKAFENKKLLKDKSVQERFGCFGNQFGVTVILSFVVSIPMVIVMEGSRLGEFFTTVLWLPGVWTNLVFSGMTFYWYNELATMTLKKVSAVTNSVANTAKRVIVIVGVAIVMGENLGPVKVVGCAIGIGGTFLYAVIDDLVKVTQHQRSNRR